ncbi:MAG: LysR family transcriptional regulator [Opitutaceae bacterium]
MELQQIRCVLAVADTGNFTRAAERLKISQPSLSQHVLNLEREVSHKLFHRLGRKAVPTEAGKVLIERGRRILFEVEDAGRELSDATSLGRRIQVGAIPTLAPYLFPSLIPLIRRKFPNIQVDIREDFRSDLVRAVVEGELDLALTSMPIDASRVHTEALWREPLQLVVAKDHPLARRKQVVAADLADQTFALLGTSSSLTAQVKSFCGIHNFEPRIAFRCAQVATVKALVALGAGVSILPQVTRAAEDEATLAYISLADAEPYREIGVVRHILRYQSRGAEQFLGAVREWAAALGTGNPLKNGHTAAS